MPSGETRTALHKAYLLPERLEATVTLQSQLRYRGLYEVPVYRAQTVFRGTFGAVDLEALRTSADDVLWNEATVVVAVSDARAITETPVLSIGGETVRFRPGNETVGQLNAPIRAPVGTLLAADPSRSLAFEFELDANGSENLMFSPLGDTTVVELQSDWLSPSFFGAYLPESREMDEDGFTARWSVSSIGRSLPAQWSNKDAIGTKLQEAAFGVRLYLPGNLYQLALRAAKYGVLFVGLTFAAYFLFETVGGMRLHPLQYLLVGLANSLFYLLLLSLAEHLGFGVAYALSAAASCGLIVGYSYSVLGSGLRAGIMTAVLGLLYLLLYVVLNAETYALLAGSVGLWFALASIMYLTRRIDWHGGENETEKGSEKGSGLFPEDEPEKQT